MNILNFTALDFETATPDHNSICQVGLVVVQNGTIIKKYSSLVKPPNNEFYYHNIQVHKILPSMTQFAPYFNETWDEFSKYIIGQHLVCHNAAFDLLKLESTLDFYNIPCPNFSYSCTLELFGRSLKQCCKEKEIDLPNHHDALSDAEACAMLYLKFHGINNTIVIEDNSPYSIKKIEKDDLTPNFNIDNKDNPFFQKKIVFTGDLISYTRNEAAHIIKLLGADVNTSISKNTDLVIIGRNPGPSKMEKIEKLGIHIISEDEFLQLIN